MTLPKDKSKELYVALLFKSEQFPYVMMTTSTVAIIFIKITQDKGINYQRFLQVFFIFSCD